MTVEKIKVSYFKPPSRTKKILVHSMRILELFLEVFGITLRRENYQKCCGLIHLNHP